ncbi:uncharacterized protein TNCV_2920911 [Trichonephila clavipes]|nr:uncharacterized protein TNCV_2920911 [Trichonephila clavipes]
MSKRCIECEHPKSGLGRKFSRISCVVYEGHISSCAINHIELSCAMEQEASLKLWQRSEDNGFRYTTLLSDGDAKTYQYLNTKEVYGPEIKIKKGECINYASKMVHLYEKLLKNGKQEVFPWEGNPVAVKIRDN